KRMIFSGNTCRGIEYASTRKRKVVAVVGTIDMNELQSLLTRQVGVTIYDHTWEDKTPLMTKKIQDVRLCPDETHLRIYFDEQRFFAVPMTASVSSSDREWIAFDEKASLHYVIKKDSSDK